MKMYKCAKCGAIAKIDKERKTIVVEIKVGNIPAPTPGALSPVAAFTFPSHPDCEFNKSVDKINLENLIEVDHTFIYETYRGVPR